MRSYRGSSRDGAEWDKVRSPIALSLRFGILSGQIENQLVIRCMQEPPAGGRLLPPDLRSQYLALFADQRQKSLVGLRKLSHSFSHQNLFQLILVN